ncbi:22323_t:CDS:2, partial [Gigaspora margarita]
PLNYDQKEKLREFVKKHESRLRRIGHQEVITITESHSFVKRINKTNHTNRHPVTRTEKRIIRITEEETATYLLYIIILQDYPKINIALQLANRSTQNITNWLKFTKSGFREHIGEFSEDSKEYRPWRNQLENAFVVYGIKEIMTYGRFSENYSTGYVRRAKNYDTAGNHAYQCRWSTEFIMRVLAIVRTKLKGTVLEIFDAEIGTINSALKDTNDYPTNLNHQYNRAFDPIATTEGARCNPHITNATVQKGFREVFDNAFLVDAIQQTAQKDFWSFDFTKGLDYSNDNGMRNLINKYKKLMQIANW